MTKRSTPRWILNVNGEAKESLNVPLGGARKWDFNTDDVLGEIAPNANGFNWSVGKRQSVCGTAKSIHDAIKSVDRSLELLTLMKKEKWESIKNKIMLADLAIERAVISSPDIKEEFRHALSRIICEKEANRLAEKENGVLRQDRRHPKGL